MGRCWGVVVEAGEGEGEGRVVGEFYRVEHGLSLHLMD